MKTSLAFLLVILISPMTYADWGDVYYCQMTTHFATSLDGRITAHELEKFQFKLDETKQAMVFRSSGYFVSTAMELEENWRGMTIMEVWRTNDGDSMSDFDEGKFLYVSTGTGSAGSNSLSADCEKF